MENAFEFLKPGRLVDGELRLVLVEKHGADPVKGYVPWYEFEMRRAGRRRRVGRISLRVGPARGLRCPGHIGYGVSKRQRGKRYAARRRGGTLRFRRSTTAGGGAWGSR